MSSCKQSNAFFSYISFCLAFYKSPLLHRLYKLHAIILKNSLTVYVRLHFLYVLLTSGDVVVEIMDELFLIIFMSSSCHVSFLKCTAHKKWLSTKLCLWSKFVLFKLYWQMLKVISQVSSLRSYWPLIRTFQSGTVWLCTLTLIRVNYPVPQKSVQKLTKIKLGILGSVVAVGLHQSKLVWPWKISSLMQQF